MQPAIHTPSIMWLLGCEFLYQCLIFIPCLPPVISLVPNGLCRIWLYGEQIHLAFDIGSLYCMNIMTTREIPLRWPSTAFPLPGRASEGGTCMS